MRAICIGECMVELREAGSGLLARGFAGDACNTAIYLKRSAPQVAVAFLTATGADPLSRAMRAAWRAEGLDESLAFTVPGLEPGLYLIEIDACGERSFHYWRSASAARQWMAALEAAGGRARLAGADLVYLSGISLAILEPDDRARALNLLQTLNGQVGRIAFDPNLRPALWESPDAARAAVETAAGLADILLPSLDDMRLLCGAQTPKEAIDWLRGRGGREIALTLGADGCVVADAQGSRRVPAPPVPAVVDTSGAGDAFSGAYLAARLTGAAPVDAARAGMALAAGVVGWPGALVPADISHAMEP